MRSIVLVSRAVSEGSEKVNGFLKLSSPELICNLEGCFLVVINVLLVPEMNGLSVPPDSLSLTFLSFFTRDSEQQAAGCTLDMLRPGGTHG